MAGKNDRKRKNKNGQGRGNVKRSLTEGFPEEFSLVVNDPVEEVVVAPAPEHDYALHTGESREDITVDDENLPESREDIIVDDENLPDELVRRAQSLFDTQARHVIFTCKPGNDPYALKNAMLSKSLRLSLM